MCLRLNGSRKLRLTAIIKDADGLDRVRLGDLNPRHLRFPVYRALVPFAEALYKETNAALNPGPDYFATMWPVAQRLLRAHCKWPVGPCFVSTSLANSPNAHVWPARVR